MLSSATPEQLCTKGAVQYWRTGYSASGQHGCERLQVLGYTKWWRSFYLGILGALSVITICAVQGSRYFLSHYFYVPVAMVSCFWYLLGNAFWWDKKAGQSSIFWTPCSWNEWAQAGLSGQHANTNWPETCCKRAGLRITKTMKGWGAGTAWY